MRMPSFSSHLGSAGVVVGNPVSEFEGNAKFVSEFESSRLTFSTPTGRLDIGQADGIPTAEWLEETISGYM